MGTNSYFIYKRKLVAFLVDRLGVYLTEQPDGLEH